MVAEVTWTRSIINGTDVCYTSCALTAPPLDVQAFMQPCRELFRADPGLMNDYNSWTIEQQADAWRVVLFDHPNIPGVWWVQCICERPRVN